MHARTHLSAVESERLRISLRLLPKQLLLSLVVEVPFGLDRRECGRAHSGKHVAGGVISHCRVRLSVCRH